jgi:hypothetical protein
VGERAGPAPRTLEELAEIVGHYCWVERRIFELAGRWSAATEAPETRVFFSEVAPRHAAWSAQWSDRLPVRAGIDAAALVVPPPGPADEALAALDAEPSLTSRLSGLVTVVLPGLHAGYRAHRAGASPVSERPVLAVLALIASVSPGETASGVAILQRQLEGSDEANSVPEFTRDFERSFGEGFRVFPAVRPS